MSKKSSKSHNSQSTTTDMAVANIEPIDGNIMVTNLESIESNIVPIGNADNIEVLYPITSTHSNATKVAAAIGYEGSMESEVIIDGIRQFQAMASYSMFEVGKRLLILKELTPHGDFLIAIDKLGIGIRTAQRTMSATMRLSKLGDHAEPLLQLPSSKLIELLVEEDDALIDLANGGSIAGLDLDEIDKTPGRILRTKLREKEADNDVLQTRNEKLAVDVNRLQNQLEKLKKREYTRDELETHRIQDCKVMRKGLSESLEKMGQQTDVLSQLLTDFWSNDASIDLNTVESAHDLLNLFNGTWIRINQQFEANLANWHKNAAPRL
ncbi:MAG: hypothetical protein QM537_03750 [Candidatus Symbiobacter sp.]|nr:hypothetical protein [Candidatus Symbiobacter sp.]